MTIDAFDKYTKYKDVAQHIKKEYDARYPSSGKSTDGVYHAVVGKHFGASFSHETSNYVHLKCDLHNVIIFKRRIRRSTWTRRTCSVTNTSRCLAAVACNLSPINE